MGGHSKKAGKGGGGGGGNRGRYCAPEERTKLHKDPGVPGADLRRAGQALTRTKAGAQRHVLNIPSLQHKKRSFGGFSSAITGEVSEEQRMSEMAAMALQAAQRQAEYHAPSSLLGEQGDGEGGNEEDYSRKGKDVSLRRFYKEFQRVVNSSDVLLEVLDVRDPMGCRLLQMERTIESQWGDKKTVVVVLNKIDLVSPDIVSKWIEYFENDQNMLVIPFTANKDNANRTACIARLFKQLRAIARGEGGARKNITVGLIGYPNVGKSSVINALKRKQVVGVGNTPGFTTGNTEVDLRQDIKIIDCPGVVMPGEDSGDVVLRNAVKVDQLPNPLVAVERLIERCDPAQLSAVYEVGTFVDTVDFVSQVGHRRGRVRQGGVVDEDETARIILHDWNDGRIGYYTLPPTSQFAFKKSSGPDDTNDDDAESDGVSVLRTLSSGMQLDSLPTFHLSSTSSAAQRKRAKLYDETWDEHMESSEDSDVPMESSDEEIDEPPSKSRRRR